MEPLGTGTLVFLVIYPWIFLHYNPVPTDTIYPILRGLLLWYPSISMVFYGVMVIWFYWEYIVY